VGGLDFSAVGGKRQKHGSALIGASNTVEPWILVQSTRFGKPKQDIGIQLDPVH